MQRFSEPLKDIQKILQQKFDALKPFGRKVLRLVVVFISVAFYIGNTQTGCLQNKVVESQHLNSNKSEVVLTNVCCELPLSLPIAIPETEILEDLSEENLQDKTVKDWKFHPSLFLLSENLKRTRQVIQLDKSDMNRAHINLFVLQHSWKISCTSLII